MLSFPKWIAWTDLEGDPDEEQLKKELTAAYSRTREGWSAATRAVASVQMSTEEYLLFYETLRKTEVLSNTTGFLDGMAAQLGLPAGIELGAGATRAKPELPANVAANLKFLRQHKKELRALHTIRAAVWHDQDRLF